jgi:hypothetical protein
MSSNFEMHSVNGIVPVANAFAGTVATDIIELQGEGILFTIIKGAGAGGTTVVTVVACDDTVPTTTHAVAFKYRVQTTSDVWGAWTAGATTGFTTTAGANQLYEVWAAAEEIAHIGYKYVKLVCVESVANAVTGCVLAQIVGGRYKEAPESYID